MFFCVSIAERKYFKIILRFVTFEEIGYTLIIIGANYIIFLQETTLVPAKLIIIQILHLRGFNGRKYWLRYVYLRDCRHYVYWQYWLLLPVENQQGFFYASQNHRVWFRYNRNYNYHYYLLRLTVVLSHILYVNV